jgi:hypothetical protein
MSKIGKDRMKVYVIVENLYNHKDIYAVFDNKEDAENFIMDCRQNFYIKEFDINETPPYVYYVHIRKEGKILVCRKVFGHKEMVEIFPNSLKIHVKANNKQEAIDKALEKIKELTITKTGTITEWKNET